MLIGPFKYFLEMDQSASRIAYLGQAMLDTPPYMLTIELPKNPTWGLTNQRARIELKGQHVDCTWFF